MKVEKKDKISVREKETKNSGTVHEDHDDN